MVESLRRKPAQLSTGHIFDRSRRRFGWSLPLTSDILESALTKSIPHTLPQSHRPPVSIPLASPPSSPLFWPSIGVQTGGHLMKHDRAQPRSRGNAPLISALSWAQHSPECLGYGSEDTNDCEIELSFFSSFFSSPSFFCSSSARGSWEVF